MNQFGGDYSRFPGLEQRASLAFDFHGQIAFDHVQQFLAPGCMCQGAAAPGGNSTMLTRVSCTTSPWPSRSLRRICVSFGPAWACASAMFAMDGAATA